MPFARRNVVKSIKREVVLPHPPERVWRALTEPRILAIWMMETTLEKTPRVGDRFQFRTKPAPGFDGIIECQFLEVDVGRRLVFSWASGKAKKHPTTVSWTLAPIAGGTRLSLEHSGFAGLLGFFMRSMMAGGWGKKVTRYLGEVVQRLADADDDVTRMNLSSVMDCDTPALELRSKADPSLRSG
jgi:uncharacterized protein YndB with AHSA1/START domain